MTEPHSPDPKFAFGKNWANFLRFVNEERIQLAQKSLSAFLEVNHLKGMTFLDVGSGSGLSSLAARRLGATVCSFDYDAQSVECTRELKRRYFPDDPEWSVSEGSALDSAFLESLGEFDIVYSWGVLHHTGSMWKAIENVIGCSKHGGLIFIALYNDQGRISRAWTTIKRNYNRLPRFLRPLYAWIVMGPREAKSALAALFRGRFGDYVRKWTRPGERGMKRWHDIVDWVGGYPFEVASSRQVIEFFEQHGLKLKKVNVCNGSGCNEFLFVQDRKSPE